MARKQKKKNRGGKKKVNAAVVHVVDSTALEAVVTEPAPVTASLEAVVVDVPLVPIAKPAKPIPHEKKKYTRNTVLNKYPDKRFPQYGRDFGETNAMRNERIDALIDSGEPVISRDKSLVCPERKNRFKLSLNHRKMARYMFSTGCTLIDAIREFKYSESYIRSHVANSKAWKDYLADLEEFDAHETSILKNKLVNMGHKAVDVLEDDLDSTIHGFKDRIVRQNAAKDVLTRIDVVGDKSAADNSGPRIENLNITQINIKELSLAEKHDLATKLMNQPMDI